MAAVTAERTSARDERGVVFAAYARALHGEAHDLERGWRRRGSPRLAARARAEREPGKGARRLSRTSRRPRGQRRALLRCLGSFATTILRQLDQFGRERSGHFAGREQSLARIALCLGASEPGLFAILGEPGVGKSALMVKVLEKARASNGSVGNRILLARRVDNRNG